MTINKRNARDRRAAKTKHIIKKSGIARLVVARSNNNISCQIVVSEKLGSKVLASSSTVEKEVKTKLSGTKTEQAFIIGKHIGEKAKKAGITEVAFDRSGYKYHGRVKALADGAREAGLNF